MNIYNINTDPFKIGLKLIVNCGKKDLSKYLKRRFGKDIEIDLSGSSAKFFWVHTKKDDKFYFYVWMESFEWRIWEQGFMVHELFHATVKIMDYVGMKLVVDSEEAYAYFLSSLVMEVWSKLRPRDEKKKTKKK